VGFLRINGQAACLPTGTLSHAILFVPFEMRDYLPPGRSSMFSPDRARRRFLLSELDARGPRRRRVSSFFLVVFFFLPFSDQNCRSSLFLCAEVLP